MTVATNPDGVSTTVAFRWFAPSDIPPKEAWPVTDAMRRPRVTETLLPSNDGMTSRPPACGASSPHADAGMTRERTIPADAAPASRMAAIASAFAVLCFIGRYVCRTAERAVCSVVNSRAAVRAFLLKNLAAYRAELAAYWIGSRTVGTIAVAPADFVETIGRTFRIRTETNCGRLAANLHNRRRTDSFALSRSLFDVYAELLGKFLYYSIV